MSRPRYGWYGDDFTGATDTLATLASAGLRATLFMGIPSAAQLEQAGPLDAIGIAGASRAMDPAAMHAELAPVGRFFADLGVSVLHYKCCSTFDSAPDRGSIGAAIAALRRHVPNTFVPILGGQPNIGRFCAFSTLFAAAGTGGEVYRLDRHPTMSCHPVTPMHEADLRRHLALQGLNDVKSIHSPAYAPGPKAALDTLTPAQTVLFDVMSEAELAAIGRVIWRRAKELPLLAVGPSSVAQALVEAWGLQAPSRADRSLPLADGPVLILAGSLSPVTRRQVAAATAFQHVAIDANGLADDPVCFAQTVAIITEHLTFGRHVLAYTAADGVPMDTTRSTEIAAGTAKLLAAILDRVSLRRLGVAGGDTSSQAVRALELWGLSYATSLAPGVAVCRAHATKSDRNGIELMLKGGQMGQDDLFDCFVGGKTVSSSAQMRGILEAST